MRPLEILSKFFFFSLVSSILTHSFILDFHSSFCYSPFSRFPYQPLYIPISYNFKHFIFSFFLSFQQVSHHSKTSLEINVIYFFFPNFHLVLYYFLPLPSTPNLILWTWLLISIYFIYLFLYAFRDLYLFKIAETSTNK